MLPEEKSVLRLTVTEFFPCLYRRTSIDLYLRYSSLRSLDIPSQPGSLQNNVVDHASDKDTPGDAQGAQPYLEQVLRSAAVFSRLVISIIAIFSTFRDMEACDEARKFWFDG